LTLNLRIGKLILHGAKVRSTRAPCQEVALGSEAGDGQCVEELGGAKRSSIGIWGKEACHTGGGS
jgi:hypothetical protein